MSVRSVTLAGRRAAESRMGATNGASTVTIRRKHPTAKVRNTSNGTEVPQWDVVAASVPARVMTDTTRQRTVTRGGVEFSVASRDLDLPASFAQTVRDGDFIEVTDGEWSGVTFSVIEAVGADQKKSLRLPVLQESRPTEWG